MSSDDPDAQQDAARAAPRKRRWKLDGPTIKTIGSMHTPATAAVVRARRHQRRLGNPVAPPIAHARALLGGASHDLFSIFIRKAPALVAIRRQGRRRRYAPQDPPTISSSKNAGAALSRALRSAWIGALPGRAAAARRRALKSEAGVRAEMDEIRDSGLFDARFYAAQHAGIPADEEAALRHYVETGASEGLSPHPLFDAEFYLSQRPKLRRAGVNPLLHYLRLGAFCEYDPSPLFSTTLYLDRYPEVFGSGRTPLQQYLERGWREQRVPHPLFDPRFYLRRNPDVEELGVDPLLHYLERGAAEGRNPHPCFETSYYLEQNPDVRAAGTNPLVHFLREGGAQGRDPSPMFDLAFYRREYPATAVGGMNPLVHFELFGSSEGLAPCRYAPPPWDLAGRRTHELRLDPGRPKAVFVVPNGVRGPRAAAWLATVAHFRDVRRMACIVLMEEDGPLHAEFEQVAVVRVAAHLGGGARGARAVLELMDLSDVRFAWFASAGSVHFLRELSERGVPSVCLVDAWLDDVSSEVVANARDHARRLVFPSRGMLAAARGAHRLTEDATRVIPPAVFAPRLDGATRAAMRRELFAAVGAAEDAFLVLGVGPLGDRAAAEDFRHAAGQLCRGAEGDFAFAWATRPGAVRSDERTVSSELPLLDLGQPADIGPWLCAADLLLATARRDGPPSIVLEAQAAGLPVVAVPETHDVAQADGAQTVRHAAAGDPRAQAEACRELAADGAARAALARAGQEHARAHHDPRDHLESLSGLLTDDLGLELEGRSRTMTQSKQGARPRVIFTTPMWNISGVNTFTESVIKGLNRRGFDAELLFTLDDVDRNFLPDVPHRFLDEAIPGEGGPVSADRWSRIIRYLVENAPCIFVPGYDYVASVVSPALPDDVGVLGVIHSDDKEHYEHAVRLGRYWNAIVAVSECCYERTVALNSAFKAVSHHIPYGIQLPTRYERPAREPGAPLRLVFSGRIEQIQKNCLAIPQLVRELDAQGFPYVLTMLGDGEEAGTLRAEMREQIDAGRVQMPGRVTMDQVREALLENDVFMLVSFFEGLPVSMLEAMAHGCVPVVSAMDSGVPELVEEGVTGYSLPVHELGAFARRLKALHEDREHLARMSRTCHERAVAHYGEERMSDDYAEVLEEVWREITRDVYRRPPTPAIAPEIGPLVLPPWLQRDPATFR